MCETKTYYDSQERPRSLSAMIRVEPEWAANRIRAGEDAEAKLTKIREAVEKCRKASPVELQLALVQMLRSRRATKERGL